MHYFDNSATTQPLDSVMATVQQVAQTYYANPSSLHPLGTQSKELLTSARRQISEILRVSPEEVYFTSSGTESNNWVLQGVVDELMIIHPNRRQVIVSAVEHPSIFEQIPVLKAKGLEVLIAPVNGEGVLDLEALKGLLSDQVLLLSHLAVNNEVGSIQPLEAVSQLLKNYPHIVWHVDGVQATTTQLQLLFDERIDCLSLSGHKFHALRGTGLLVLKERVSTRPFLYGGGQERGYRSGTEALPTIAGTARALRVAWEGQDALKERLASYRQRIVDYLSKLQWEIYGGNSTSEHIVCAGLAPVPGEVLVHALAEHQVLVSTTSACSSRRQQFHSTLTSMQVPEHLSASAIRISMGQLTSQEDVDQLLKALSAVTEQLR